MNAHGEVVIEVDQLRRNYGRFQAVRDVGSQVGTGELFALLVTNGAGKTTTIDVLEHLQPPSAGVVPVFRLDPSRERLEVAVEQLSGGERRRRSARNGGAITSTYRRSS